jgi:uncharacterized protein
VFQSVTQLTRTVTARLERNAWNTVVDDARKAFPLERGLPDALEREPMTTADSPPTRFEVTETTVDIDTLVVGFTEYGLAGLTAVDYISEQLSMTQVGHLVAPGQSTITPFEQGVPRHHTRLYVDEARSLGVVVGERIVPVDSAAAIAGAVERLYEQLTPDSLTVLSGIPVAHGPEDHVPFYIATEDYRDRYLANSDIRPMGTGFLDGVTAELVADGIDDDERPVGVFTTPAHPQAPDAAAAIRLLEALTETHDIDVDVGPLEEFAATVEAQYRALAERMESTDDRSMPDDRMYM